MGVNKIIVHFTTVYLTGVTIMISGYQPLFYSILDIGGYIIHWKEAPELQYHREFNPLAT